MNEDIEPKPRKSSGVPKRFIIYAGVLLVIFLLGFIPMWLKARTANTTLVETQHQLFLVRMQNDLASAVIDARRGEYENARKSASQFLTSVREDIDKGDASNFTPGQREGLKPLLAGRDDLITLLARSDPASADRLSDLYAAYRKLMNS